MKIFPDVITTSYIISQVLGFLSIVIIGIGFFTSRKKLFIFQIVGNFLIACSYIFIFSTVGWIGSLISTLRSVVIFLYDQKNKKLPTAIMSLIILLYVGCVCVDFCGYYDIFQFICYIVYTLGMCTNNELLSKALIASALIFGLVYNLILLNFFGSIRNLIEIIVVIISIVKFEVKIKKEKKYE